jgi:hypothetical protein
MGAAASKVSVPPHECWAGGTDYKDCESPEMKMEL